MTTRQFYSEYWKPLFLTIIPTILMAGFAAFVGVKVAIATIQIGVINNKEDITEIKHEAEIYQKSVWDLQQDCQFIKGKLGITTTRGGE